MIKTSLRIPLTLNSLLKELVFKISPGAILIIMATSIFLVEAFVMFILSEIPPLPRNIEAILDSTILICLLTPFYLYIYKPFWKEHQKQSQQIRFLSQQLLSATEEESKRIAHEIHDQCGQTLTALQFGIQTLRRLISNRTQEALEKVDDLEQIASKLSGELRELTSRLRPPILDQAGLVSALNWQIDEFKKNYPSITINKRLFRKTDLPRRVASVTEDAIYRICQEAFTNIARHASATEIDFSLIFENNTLELKIEDNGSGFNIASCLEREDGSCGIGILGMRERTLMVGGRYEIISQPGKGTAILASFQV